MRRLAAFGLGLVLLLSLGLAACTPERAPDLAPVGEARVELDRLACTKRGGSFGSTSQGYLCQQRLKDGGKACRTGSDCEGDCLARSMTCAPAAPLIGCNEVITDFGLRATQCMD